MACFFGEDTLTLYLYSVSLFNRKIRLTNTRKLMFYYLLRILFLFCVLVIAACTRDRQVDKFIDYAQQSLCTQPDSALYVLNGLDKKKTCWPKSQRMRYELVYAQAQNKAFIPFTTDSIVLELADYYNHHGSINERMIANYMVGCAYRDLEDASLALKYLNIAADVAEENNEGCDLKVLMGVHSQMGALYQNVSAFENECLEDQKAEKLAWQIGDTLSAIHLRWARAVSLYDHGSKLQAINLLDSIELFQRYHKLEEEPYVLYPMKISYSILIRDDRNAAKLLQEYEEKMHISQSFSEDEITFISYLRMKGDYLVMTQSPDSAIQLYQRLLRIIPNQYLLNDEQIGLKRDACCGLSKSYIQKHQMDSAMIYAELYCSLGDSLVFQNAAEALIRVQSLYNYSRIQEQALKSEHDAYFMRLSMVVLTFVVLVLVLVVWIKYKSWLKKERSRLTEANKEYQLLLQEMDKSTKELRLFKKDSERFRRQKEDEIQKLHSALAMYRDNEVDIELWDKERSIIDCEIAHHLHSLSARGKMATQSELDSLSNVARDAFPHFFDRISQEAIGLSAQEVLVCVFIRFRFIPSEIVILTGYSSQRVTNIKASVNKKLFGKTGAKTLEACLLSMK